MAAKVFLGTRRDHYKRVRSRQRASEQVRFERAADAADGPHSWSALCCYRFPANLEPELLVKRIMNTQQRSTVVGVFEDRLHANQAITELHQAGFTEAQIGVAMRHAEGVGDTA